MTEISIKEELDDFVNAAIENDPELDAKLLILSAECIQAGRSIDFKLIHQALKKLRTKRRFGATQMLAEKLSAIGLEDAVILKAHGQSLIEAGQYKAALGLLEQARELANDTGDMASEEDTYGLVGRVYKDLYINGATKSAIKLPQKTLKMFLNRSVDSYFKIWKRGLHKDIDRAYHGVNALAVSMRARRDGIAISDDIVPSQIAIALLEDANLRFANAAHPDAGKSDRPALQAWDYANTAEACAALDRWDEALIWINRYLKHAKHDPFALNGTLRQFEEVWGVDKADPVKGPIVTALQVALITAEGGGTVLPTATLQTLQDDANRAADQLQSRGNQAFALCESAPLPQEEVRPPEDDSDANERVLGGKQSVSMTRLKAIMDKARYVGRVVFDRHTGPMTIGTGFLLSGHWIDPARAQEVYFFTNAHVVSDNPQRDGTPIGPGRAYATFDLVPQLGQLPLNEMIWCSGQHEHDMSVFRIPNVKIADLKDSMGIAKGLPKLKRKPDFVPRGKKPEDLQPIPGTVYVIGHPSGRELSYSLYDNDLIDYEYYVGEEGAGQQPRRIHYRAPTEKGNSGSPVFNSRTLELIGVHHRGGRLKRLNGKSGRNAANEGLWIRPAINEIRQILQHRGDMFHAIEAAKTNAPPVEISI